MLAAVMYSSKHIELLVYVPYGKYFFRTIEIRNDKVYSQLNNAILSVAYANLEAKGIDQCHRVVLESESNDTNMV